MAVDPDDVASGVYTGSELLTLRGALLAGDELLSRERFTSTFDVGLAKPQIDTIRDLVERVGGVIGREGPSADEDVTVNMTLRQAQAIRDVAATIEDLVSSNAGRNLLSDVGINPNAIEREELVSIRTSTPSPPQDMIDDLRGRGDVTRLSGGRDMPDTGRIVTDMGVPDDEEEEEEDFTSDRFEIVEDDLVIKSDVDVFSDVLPDDLQHSISPIENTADRLETSMRADESLEGVLSHRQSISDLVTDGDPPRCRDIISGLSDCVEFSIRASNLPEDERQEVAEAYEDLSNGILDIARRVECFARIEMQTIEFRFADYLDRLEREDDPVAILNGARNALEGVARAAAGFEFREQTDQDITSTQSVGGSSPPSADSAAEKLNRMDPQESPGYLDAAQDETFQSLSQTFAAYEDVDVRTEPADVLLVDLGTIIRKVGAIGVLGNESDREELIDRAQAVYNEYRAELREMGVVEGERGGTLDDAAMDSFRAALDGSLNILVVHQVIQMLEEVAREEGL